MHTGQHYDPELSDIFFKELDIPRPAYSLGIHGGTHGEMTGRMLQHLEKVMLEENPSIVLVYGDTNSTLAGALAAAKIHIPVAHVEAGLRSFNPAMPEEINRVIADHISSVLFCPTRAAVANLKAEGLTEGVRHVGDVMFDVALHAAKMVSARSGIFDQLGIHEGSYAVATIHRAENTDDSTRLRNLIDYLDQEAKQQPIIFPVHPRTRKALDLAGIGLGRLRLLSPLGYLDMTRLVQGAATVYTDSGGLQKEAYFHRVPCVTLREETEWVETIKCGWNRLWTEPSYRERRNIDEYGDGNAAEKIATWLEFHSQ